ncbi:MAG TPA: hypothetical protein VGH90_00335 [Chthoniobacteraceae bacterium]
MSFEDFQHLARLFVLGALDEQELTAFELGRKEFGERAEEYIKHCTELSSAFALSLQPKAPTQDAKERLMSLIRDSERGKRAAAGKR